MGWNNQDSEKENYRYILAFKNGTGYRSLLL